MFVVNTNPVREAWFEAALDLRIRIQEPNPLEGVPDDSARVVYLPDFGGKRGAVVFVDDFGAGSRPSFDTSTKLVQAAGYFFSIVSLKVYSRYNREDFIETLVDWGYFGSPEGCPEWYTQEIEKLTKMSEQRSSANTTRRR